MSEEQLADTLNMEQEAGAIETPAPEEKPAAEVQPEPVKEPSLEEKLSALAKKKEAPETKTPAKADAVVTPPAYTANYKFKVHDKDHEIPEAFRGLVKDAATEKMVREVFEKSLGLDEVKPKLAETRAERDRFATENSQIKEGIDGCRKIYQSAKATGNWLKMDDFFARLQIPVQDVMQFALAKVQFGELPEDQKQRVLGQLDADRRAEQAGQQAAQTQSTAQNYGQQLKELGLKLEFSKPEVSAIQADFDTRVGKPGSFRQQVVNAGLLAWQSKGIDLSPEQAVAEVIASLGLKPPVPAAAPASEVVAPVQASGKKVIQRETKVIPNLQGGGGSPLQAKPRSIADLEKLRDAAIAKSS